MLKTFMQRLGLILGGILVAFVVAEIAVRVLNLAPAEFYTYDRYVGWKIKPNYSGWQKHEGVALMGSNSEGFRGPEYSLLRIRFARSFKGIFKGNVRLQSVATANRSACSLMSK
jgi:hypothetical protein